MRDFEELIPGFRDIALRKSSLLECFWAVIHRQRYDLERDSIDLFINDPGFHHVWKKVVFRGVLHVRSEVDQNATIVVTKKVPGADYENIRTLTRGESGL